MATWKKKVLNFAKSQPPCRQLKEQKIEHWNPPLEAHALQCSVMPFNPNNDEMCKSPLRRWKVAVQAEASWNPSVQELCNFPLRSSRGSTSSGNSAEPQRTQIVQVLTPKPNGSKENSNCGKPQRIQNLQVVTPTVWGTNSTCSSVL
jgi:hypothetical protein